MNRIVPFGNDEEIEEGIHLVQQALKRKCLSYSSLIRAASSFSNTPLLLVTPTVGSTVSLCSIHSNLDHCHPWHADRAQMLVRLGRNIEARLTTNRAERE